ncbi:hypothetical protein BV20DRAFT_1035697 [Pilatotrama ljubarskyi]|nr:hypothetical protein BV20DRAFT_1035697 [Pilatotrama ljubarskyi]
MLLPSLSSFPLLLLALCLLLAHSPTSALSIPPSLKSPARVKSLRTQGQDQWTNAQRLAAGLPPRAPRTFKRATSTAADPLAPAPVRRSAPSPSPSFAFSKTRPLVETSYSGRIVARDAGTEVPVGYVRASQSGVSLGSDQEGAAHVAFTTTGSKALFSISNLEPTVTTDAEAFAAAQASPFIGGSGTSVISAGSSRYCASAHARPAAAGADGAESTIWTFDAATQALTAHWVNPDGSHPKTRVAYSARDGSLVLTGDVAAYQQAHPDDHVSEVTLQFVSD